MLRVEDCLLILLAAGKSRRFDGVHSKLDQDLLGRPLGLHAAAALAGVPFRARVAVIDRPDLDYEPLGCGVIRNLEAALGMAGSVKLGVRRAVAIGARSALIALADMPRVTAAHVHRLFDASTDADTIVASSDGRYIGPPALFGSARFAALLDLDGDAGARALVRAGRHVVTTPAELIDVDTVEDLDRLRARADQPATR